ncbi:MAG: hypothetical protein ACI9IA_000210 [Enterobacterales bacterium]|jgi:hypothetical protein
MFILRTKRTNHNLNLAIERANHIVSSDEFYDGIIVKDSFDMATCKGSHIVNQMRDFKMAVNVKVYFPKFYFSRALGFYDRREPFDINLNRRKLNRSVNSLTNTLIHEWVHMVDYFDNFHSYGHGDNKRQGKENTAPYFIGLMASGLSFSNKESQMIKTKRSFMVNTRRFYCGII